MSLKDLNVTELASFIKQCEKSGGAKTKAQREKLAKARLKMACWVCKREGLEPNMINLAGILGKDFKDATPYISGVVAELGPDGPKI